MGDVAAKICGGTGIMDMLIKKYGDDVGKFIAIQKVKQILDGKLGDLKRIIGQQSGGILQQVTGTIDGKKNQLTNTFQQYKQMINEKVPGGISSVQKLKGQSIESMLGYNQFMRKFDQVKSTATTKFNQQQQNVFSTIDNTGKQQKQFLNQQRPQIPIYDQLSESQQKVVFKEGEKMFANQIQQHQDTVMNQLGDKLNPETYLGNFKNIVPLGSLDGILGNAMSKFEGVKNLLSGGGLGGFAQSFGNMF